MSEATPTSQAIVDRILGGQAPLALRAAAARGALPLPRAALTRLHLHLLNDPEETVRQDAQASLDAVGESELREILADAGCDGTVLAHFAQRALRQEALAEMVIFHKAVPPSALAILAERGSASIIELLLTNQEGLLRSPGLLDRLSQNPALRPDQRGKILDLLARFVSVGAQDDGTAAARSEDEGTEAAEVDLEEAARLLDVDVGDLFASSEILDGEEFEQAEDPEIRSAYRRILTLNTAQKAMLAMRGGREERLILIRDSNKVVALCVLRNPRLVEQEVDGIARMRNVSDEVLRTIGNKRAWVKHYSVAAALVRNPKTPPGISTNLIPRLTNHDLKMLARDKNVPEMIRRMAKRTHDTRTQRTSSFRKGRKAAK